MPTRSCVVCRGKDEQRELLRVALVGCDGGKRLTFDLLHELVGRGFYCHATVRCLLSRKFRSACYSAVERGWRKQRGGTAKPSLPSDAELFGFDGVLLSNERKPEVEMNSVAQGLRDAVSRISVGGEGIVRSKRRLAAIKRGEDIVTVLFEAREQVQQRRDPKGNKQRIRL